MHIFLAGNFCFEPADEGKNPFGRKITKFNRPTLYYKFNNLILERISELSDPDYFQSIVRTLKWESLGLKELEKGPEIFKSYHESVMCILENEKNKAKRLSKLGVFLDNLNEEYPLENYMKELSLRFDAEEFFREVTRELSVE